MTRNLVVCCDGTSNQFESDNTNVVKLFRAIERDTPDQVAFYDPGVGTVGTLGWSIGKGLGKCLGKLFGFGVRQNIEDAYRFLMNTYQDGDRVFIFGFSRGAFTARSLAAMLHDVGLLHPGNENLIPYASKRFLAPDGHRVNTAFKTTFARECQPHVVGVWDTVGSLGWFIPLRRFRDDKLSPDVGHAFHAVALDEKRRKFPPTLWDETSTGSDQVVRQMWFAGVHSDVGGGYPERGLSDIALKWMLEQAAGAGLKIKESAWQELAPDPFGTMHETYKGWWKLLGPHVRERPEDPSCVHDSVQQREQR